ncbi:MAG: diacylglycerol kinase [Alphaproteobacteria bacterium]|nr:diacylglycerol kinase [Alphaproteobacteria bacterium]
MNRIIKAFKYSVQGIVATWQSEPAFRQETVVFAVGLLIAILLPVGFLARSLMVSSMILVLLAELANTAIESVVDRISTDRHPLSKKAKDIGSALVLLSIINAGIIWFFVVLDFLIL